MVRMTVPADLATRLARECDLGMTAHEWHRSNVDAARAVLAEEPEVVRELAAHLARTAAVRSGWVVLSLPADLADDELLRASAGLLAALGQPFNSIDDRGRLWIGRESSSDYDAASFGGFGPQPLHIDAPNVERVPDYTSLLVLRPDPAGGGASRLGDLRAAVAALSDEDRAILGQPVFYEGRAVGLRGVGAARLPFPVLEDLWIRWAGKMLMDDRNAGMKAVLERFSATLDATTTTVALRRGEMVVLDQQRVAHGRTALNDQSGLADGIRRLLVQAKVALDPTAPAQR